MRVPLNLTGSEGAGSGVRSALGALSLFGDDGASCAINADKDANAGDEADADADNDADGDAGDAGDDAGSDADNAGNADNDTSDSAATHGGAHGDTGDDADGDAGASGADGANTSDSANAGDDAADCGDTGGDTGDDADVGRRPGRRDGGPRRRRPGRRVRSRPGRRRGGGGARGRNRRSGPDAGVYGGQKGVEPPRDLLSAGRVVPNGRVGELSKLVDSFLMSRVLRVGFSPPIQDLECLPRRYDAGGSRLGRRGGGGHYKSSFLSSWGRTVRPDGQMPATVGMTVAAINRRFDSIG